MRKIKALQEVLPSYDAFLIDIWGVIHGGGPIYPEATNCLKSLLSLGKEIVLLSNAPRRTIHVSKLLESKGLPNTLCNNIMSSGEATRRALSTKSLNDLSYLGHRYILIGPQSDSDLLHELPYKQVKSLSKADFILAIGLNSGTNTTSEHMTLLSDGIDKRIPMLCVNPDIEVIRLGKRELCAGAIAEKYKELGGKVLYFGKPHKFIYELCLDSLLTKNRERILCIGDGINTDILGAKNMGLDGLLITGGLLAGGIEENREEDISMQHIGDICFKAGVRPIGVMKTLEW